MHKKVIGKLGELMALKFLTNQNYELIKRNYYWRGGEIDLILKEKQEIVFVEVKTRTNNKFGEAIESLSINQRRKIINSINYFFLTEKSSKTISWRMDLITVKLDLKNMRQQINHHKNILDE